MKNLDYDAQKVIHEREFKILRSFLSRHQHYRNYGLTGHVENDKEVWKNIPILTKKRIQGENLKEYYFEHKLKGTKTVYTGGSTTGEPVVFIEDKRSGDYARAYFYLALYRLGWDLSKPWIKLWGRPELNRGIVQTVSKSVSYFLQNCAAFDAFNMSDDLFCNLYNRLAKTQHSHIYGYVNAIVEFAKYIETNRLRVEIGFILTTGEVLTEGNKLYLERIFECPVYNGYACTEINSVAYSDLKGDKLIINTERVYLEIVGEDDDLLPNGQIGRVILTDLQKRSFPLVRYDTGDTASVLEGKHSNGKKFYYLSDLNGRVSDVIRTTRGNTVHSIAIQFLLADFFSELKIDLLKFQVVQKPDKSLEFRLDSRQVLDEAQRKDLKLKLVKNLQKELTVVFTDEFSYTKSGKIKYFIIEEN
ncbi:hypothetical protein OAF68_01590 [Akkermansiaceae bacterium]|nr:hypothetical protein [Akkermansiaceae bacterium]